MSAFTPERIESLREMIHDPHCVSRFGVPLLEALDEIERLSKPRPLLKKGANEEWGTPAKIFDPLNLEFGFTLDVCATKDNKKCPSFFSKEHPGGFTVGWMGEDGLTKDWKHYSGGGACWMNPPYNSKALYAWTKKAYEESLRGVTTVCLVPAKMDQPWWHEYAVKGEIRPIKGRVKFEGAKHTALFSCAILVFRGNQ
jgi:phage N-6-adenine-methyltransferase